jgi:hypothetical protein
MSGTSRGVDGGAPGNAARLVPVALFALGVVVRAAMSIAAYRLAYFPADFTISQDVQAYHPAGWTRPRLH